MTMSAAQALPFIHASNVAAPSGYLRWCPCCQRYHNEQIQPNAGPDAPTLFGLPIVVNPDMQPDTVEIRFGTWGQHTTPSTGS